MITLNIKRVMRLRGIDDHYKMLLDLGFAPATVRRFLRNELRRVDFDHLEKICLALNCTPNDLLEWRPSEKQANSEAQALIKLNRKSEEDVTKLLNKMPMDKFEQILNVLQDLNGKEQ